MTSPQLGERTRRHGWVAPLVVLLLIAVPILEVWLLIQVGHRIGVLPTLAILLAEAVLGGWLLRREGRRAWTALNDAFATGRMPSGELTDAALVLVGGVLLIVPGFLTDLLGLLFLLPFTRAAARRLLGYFVARRLQRAGLTTTRPKTSEVIEGEVVEDVRPPSTPNDIRVISGEVLDHDR